MFGQSKRTPLSAWPSRDLSDSYKIIAPVGSGNYGQVFKAHDARDSSKIVALKKFDTSMETEGFPVTALREIKILQTLNHPNIVKLIEVITHEKSTYLALEYMDHDFWGLQQLKVTFSLPQIKCLMKQLFEGLVYMHEKNFIHRDIKGANILLNNKGILKIADFGLSCAHTQKRRYTSRVVTLPYRAPELLLGSSRYSSKIDIWSAGCFMAELFLGDLFFRANHEKKMLELIYERCGTPNDESWPEVKNLERYNDLKPERIYLRTLISYLRTRKPNFDEDALDLLDKMLVLNPSRRLTAKQCLEHSFFKNEPLACETSQLPRVEHECHGFNRNDALPPHNNNNSNVFNGFNNHNQNINGNNRGNNIIINYHQYNNFNINNNHFRGNNNFKRDSSFNDNNRRGNFGVGLRDFGQYRNNPQINVNLQSNASLCITFNGSNQVILQNNNDGNPFRNKNQANLNTNNLPENSNQMRANVNNFSENQSQTRNSNSNLKRKTSVHIDNDELERKEKILVIEETDKDVNNNNNNKSNSDNDDKKTVYKKM